MTRRVVTVRLMWWMLALWVALDATVSFTGTPWPSSRTFVDRMLDDVGLAVFLLALTACSDKTPLTSQDGTKS